MHRLAAAVCLIIFVVAVIFTGRKITITQCESHRKYVKSSLSSIKEENWKNAKSIAENSVKEWESGEKKLAVFLKRETLDEIRLSYSELNAAIDCKDKNIAITKCALIEALIDEIDEKEEFSVMSFF
ncbi:MAG: DUF4363 family protein [Clostridia bacterium]|nr:DUF4363 family protein [Clostridia bacterium]